MPPVKNALRRRIPNMVTVLRLFLAAGFFAALSGFRFPLEGTFWGNFSIGLFVLAAATDALDGYLARRWHVESMFGRIMDPFCDKVLVLGAFIYLAGPRFVVPDWLADDRLLTMASGVYPWMVVIIIARELLVTGIRDVLESMGESGGAKWAGKAKMILQSIAVPIVLFIVVNLRPDQHAWAMTIVNILIWAMLIITVWSGIPYVSGLRAVLRRKGT
jgi:phosphatidylglycerophosphate synthase